MRLLPLVLLIVVGLAGLRGAVGTCAGTGRCTRTPLVVGVVLEVVIVTLFVILLVRRAAGQPGADRGQAARGAHARARRGRDGAAVLVLVGAAPARVRPGTQAAADPGSPRRPPRLAPAAPGIRIGAALPGDRAALRPARRGAAGRGRGQHLVGQAAAAADRAPRRTTSSRRIRNSCARRWSRAVRRCGRWTTPGPPSSRATWPWRPRLAERGTARGVAGTPGELLTRATEAGLVRGTAAGQLTALFYEARFSSHPLGHRQRDAAERALDELAADLAETEGAAR